MRQGCVECIVLSRRAATACLSRALSLFVSHTAPDKAATPPKPIPLRVSATTRERQGKGLAWSPQVPEFCSLSLREPPLRVPFWGDRCLAKACTVGSVKNVFEHRVRRGCYNLHGCGEAGWRTGHLVGLSRSAARGLSAAHPQY